MLTGAVLPKAWTGKVDAVESDGAREEKDEKNGKVIIDPTLGFTNEVTGAPHELVPLADKSIPVTTAPVGK